MFGAALVAQKVGRLSAPLRDVQTDREELNLGFSAQEAQLVARLLERDAYSELFLADRLGMGVTFAPSIDDKILVAEESIVALRHFEIAASLHENFSAEDLIDVVRLRVDDVPLPSTWADVVMLRVLGEHARIARIGQLSASRLESYAEIASRLVAGSYGSAASEAALLDLGATELDGISSLQATVDRWLLVFLQSIGRSAESEPSRAETMELIGHSNSVARFRFVSLLSPVMGHLGVQMPDPC